MTPKTCRPFTLADAMILVAATAVGMAGHGVIMRMELLNSGQADLITLQSLPFLTAWTFAYLAVRSRGPRPGRRRLMAQPGMVACCTIALSLGMFVFIFVFIILAKDLVSGRGAAEEILRDISEIIIETWRFFLFFGGTTVLAAWGVLALGGRCRREPGWIDWLGISLGIAWTGMSFCGLARAYWT